MVVDRTKRKTDPAPVTGPVLSRELRAVRQELRMQTLTIVVGVALILLFGQG